MPIGMQRTLPGAHTAARDEEEEFLRQSREIGVEFVRLFLEDHVGARNGAAVMGPGPVSDAVGEQRRESEDDASGGSQPSTVGNMKLLQSVSYPLSSLFPF